MSGLLGGNDTALHDAPLAHVYEARSGSHDGGRHVRLLRLSDNVEPADFVDLAAMAGVAPGIEDPAVARMFVRDPGAYEGLCRARVEAAARKDRGGRLSVEYAHLKRTEVTRRRRSAWRQAMVAPAESRRIKTSLRCRPMQRGHRSVARIRRPAGAALARTPDPEPDPDAQPPRRDRSVSAAEASNGWDWIEGAP